MPSLQKPTNAFVFASWIAVGTGILGFIIGLWQSDLVLNERAVTVQKNTRDALLISKSDEHEKNYV